MKLFARDHKSRAGLLSGLLDICDVLTKPSEITITGFTSISNPTSLKSVTFLMVDEESADEKTDFFLKLYIWEYIEICIETDPNPEKDYVRVSKSTLRKVLDKWQSYDSYLAHNKITLDTYFNAKTFSHSGSFILTKKDLLILLSLKGCTSLREVMYSRADLEEVFYCIQKAINNNVIKPKSYSLQIDYKKSIELLGFRLNRLIQTMNSKEIASSNSIISVLEKRKETLIPDFKDMECISITQNGIDLSDVMSSLNCSLDKDVLAAVGSSILIPLSYLYAGLIISFAFEGHFEKILGILTEIEISFDNSTWDSYRAFNSALGGKFA